jgi:hypothetical protein
MNAPTLEGTPTQDSRDRVRGDVLAFLVPAVIFVEIHVVGRLFLSEIFLLAALPFLLEKRGALLLESLPKRVWLCALIWLAAQMYADSVNGTAFEDWSRGWSKITFLILNFCSLYLLLSSNTERRVRLFAIGIIVGGVLQFFISPSQYAVEYPWKFGLGPPITLALVMLSQSVTFQGSAGARTALLLGATALNFVLGFRSLGAFCLLTACYLWYQRSGQSRRVRVVPLVLIAIIAVYLMAQLYGYVATAGWLGDEAKEKYERQSSGEFGLLLGARVELLASSQAIIDSPIVGHGSWARDFEYVALLNDRLAQYGYEVTTSADSELVPSHSYLLSAWVEAGILGVLFWGSILLLAGRALTAGLSRTSPLDAVTAFFGFRLLWDVLFSPFGAEARIYTPYVIVLLLFAIKGQRATAPISTATSPLVTT